MQTYSCWARSRAEADVLLLGSEANADTSCWKFWMSGADVLWCLLGHVMNPRRSEMLTFEKLVRVELPWDTEGCITQLTIPNGAIGFRMRGGTDWIVGSDVVN